MSNTEYLGPTPGGRHEWVIFKGKRVRKPIGVHKRMLEKEAEWEVETKRDLERMAPTMVTADDMRRMHPEEPKPTIGVRIMKMLGL